MLIAAGPPGLSIPHPMSDGCHGPRRICPAAAGNRQFRATRRRLNRICPNRAMPAAERVSKPMTDSLPSRARRSPPVRTPCVRLWVGGSMLGGSSRSRLSRRRAVQALIALAGAAIVPLGSVVHAQSTEGDPPPNEAQPSGTGQPASTGNSNTAQPPRNGNRFAPSPPATGTQQTTGNPVVNNPIPTNAPANAGSQPGTTTQTATTAQPTTNQPTTAA